jgi:hypothetical protein
MPILTWTTDPRITYGVDQGVLYPEDSVGVAWNGLLRVDESYDTQDVDSYYMDGIKYASLRQLPTFKVTVSALSTPPEFDRCAGELPVIPGFSLTRQQRARFGFSYRTLSDLKANYKIHVLYNVIATPTDREQVTMTGAPSASMRTWRMDAVPPEPTPTYAPSAHYIFDSLRLPAEKLAVVEAVLYGTPKNNPRLPSMEEVLDLLHIRNLRLP